MLPERRREMDSLHEKLEAARSNKMYKATDDATKKPGDPMDTTNDGAQSKQDSNRAEAGGTSPVPAPGSQPSSCNNSQTGEFLCVIVRCLCLDSFCHFNFEGGGATGVRCGCRKCRAQGYAVVMGIERQQRDTMSDICCKNSEYRYKIR